MRSPRLLAGLLACAVWASYTHAAPVGRVQVGFSPVGGAGAAAAGAAGAAVNSSLRSPASLSLGASSLPSASENPALVLGEISARYGTDPDPDAVADLGEGDYAEVRSGFMPAAAPKALGRNLPAGPGEAVAVKIPYLDPGGMIAHEAEVSRRLEKAGGGDVFVRAVEDPEQGVLVMEKLEGYRPMEEWMDAQGKVPMRTFKKIASQLMRGLEVLEKAGLVHSDLKPDNVLIAPDGSVKIVDFGITADVKAYPPYKDYAGWRGGLYVYTSDNQLHNGPAEFSDDRHSVGVLLGRLGALVPGVKPGDRIELASLSEKPKKKAEPSRRGKNAADGERVRKLLVRRLRERIGVLVRGVEEGRQWEELAELEAAAYRGSAAKPGLKTSAKVEAARVLMRMLGDPQLIVQSKGFIKFVGLKEAAALEAVSRRYFQTKPPGKAERELMERLRDETPIELDEALPSVDRRTRKWFLEPSRRKMRDLPDRGLSKRKDHLKSELERVRSRGAGARNFGLPSWVRLRAPEAIKGKKAAAVDAALAKVSPSVSKGPRVLSAEELDLLHDGRAAPSRTLTQGRRRTREHNNLRAAAELVNGWVREGRDLDLDMLQSLGAVLLKGTEKWREAGRLRGFENGLDVRGDHVSFAILEHLLAYLRDFMAWYDANKGTMHPVKLAALSYQQLVRIHPLINTNGRAGRLIMDFILQRNGYLPAVFEGIDDATITRHAADVIGWVSEGVQRADELTGEAGGPSAETAAETGAEAFAGFAQDLAPMPDVEADPYEDVRAWMREGLAKYDELIGKLSDALGDVTFIYPMMGPDLYPSIRRPTFPIEYDVDDPKRGRRMLSEVMERDVSSSDENLLTSEAIDARKFDEYAGRLKAIRGRRVLILKGASMYLDMYTTKRSASVLRRFFREVLRPGDMVLVLNKKDLPNMAVAEEEGLRRAGPVLGLRNEDTLFAEHEVMDAKVLFLPDAFGLWVKD